jgi:hypothetical protein
LNLERALDVKAFVARHFPKDNPSLARFWKIRTGGTNVIYPNYLLLSDDVLRVPFRSAMSPKILDVLMLQRCCHEFSWPRRAADGHYYQVCLRCAAAYNYDWKRMRRIEPVIESSEMASEHHRRQTHQKPSWIPRARRLTLRTPIRYRVKALATWHEGIVGNAPNSDIEC